MGESKDILIIFPTNIGDAVIALPVLDRARENFPQAKLSVFTSPRTDQFLSRNDFIDQTVLFDKRWPKKSKFIFVAGERNKYDTVIDLKNSLFPFLLGARHFTPVLRLRNKDTRAADEYLTLVKKLLPRAASKRSHFPLNVDEKKKIDSFNLKPGTIFLACASRSHLKQYDKVELKVLAQNLAKKYPVAVLGEECDREYYSGILAIPGVVDLTGKTTFIEIFYLLDNYAKALVCVDSAIMQAASYCDIKIVALFGPTDSSRYGPWSSHYAILGNGSLDCAPCAMAVCKNNYECMKIDAAKVSVALEDILNEKS